MRSLYLVVFDTEDIPGGKPGRASGRRRSRNTQAGRIQKTRASRSWSPSILACCRQDRKVLYADLTKQSKGWFLVNRASGPHNNLLPLVQSIEFSGPGYLGFAFQQHRNLRSGLQLSCICVLWAVDRQNRFAICLYL